MKKHLAPADPDEVRRWADSLAFVLSGGGTRDLAPEVANMITTFPAVVHDIDISPTDLHPIPPSELVATLDDERKRAFIAEAVTIELSQIDPDRAVADSISDAAEQIGVGAKFASVARTNAIDSAGAIFADTARAVDRKTLLPEMASRVPPRYRESVAKLPPIEPDPLLEERWRATEKCADGTLGALVAMHYHDNNFTWPGSVEAGKLGIGELVARHDFSHVIADYATTSMGELEVFTFWACTSDDPRVWPILMVVVALFSSGRASIGELTQGKLEVDLTNDIHEGQQGATLVADAARRGLALQTDLAAGADPFAWIDLPIDEVRDNLGLLPKSQTAIDAGSEHNSATGAGRTS